MLLRGDEITRKKILCCFDKYIWEIIVVTYTYLNAPSINENVRTTLNICKSHFSYFSKTNHRH